MSRKCARSLYQREGGWLTRYFHVSLKRVGTCGNLRVLERVNTTTMAFVKVESGPTSLNQMYIFCEVFTKQFVKQLIQILLLSSILLNILLNNYFFSKYYF